MGKEEGRAASGHQEIPAPRALCPVSPDTGPVSTLGPSLFQGLPQVSPGKSFAWR